MPRKRKYTSTSPVRHKAKMERVFLGRVTEETGIQVADAINAEWLQAFGYWRDLYRELQEFLKGKGVPRGLYGLYRSFLFKAKKVHLTGGDVDRVVEEFHDKCGLDEGLMREICDHFGITIKKAPEEIAPSR